MASTTFIDQQTVIVAAWLNDVNTAVYSGTFPNGNLSLTNLSVSGTVSGAGFTTLVNNTLSSPGAIGGVTPNTGKFTTLQATSLTGLTTALSVDQGGTGLTAVGTSGNVLTSNGSAWISSAPAVIKGLGYNGETWHDVSSSRSSGTTYTNSNGYPIMVVVSTANGTSQSVVVVVGGVTVSSQVGGGSGYTQGVMGAAIVPTGATYSVTFSGSSPKWTELY